RRAIVRLGDTPLTNAPAGNGLWLAGNIDTLPLQAWFETLQQLQQPANTNNADTDKHGGLPFLGANLAIANLRLGRRQIDVVDIRASALPATAGWHIAIDGAGTRGQATWHRSDDGRGRLQARLTALQIHTQPAAP